jgi:hypothetical protein
MTRSDLQGCFLSHRPSVGLRCTIPLKSTQVPLLPFTTRPRWYRQVQGRGRDQFQYPPSVLTPVLPAPLTHLIFRLDERDRKLFLNRLGHGLMAYGAPSDRVQSQLLRAARVLQVDCEVVHIPGILLLTLGDLTSPKLRPTLSNPVRALTLGNWRQWMQFTTMSSRTGSTFWRA